MKLRVDVPDDFKPVDGNALDAVRDALEHFEIPSQIEVIVPDDIQKLKALKGNAELAKDALHDLARSFKALNDEDHASMIARMCQSIDGACYIIEEAIKRTENGG